MGRTVRLGAVVAVVIAVAAVVSGCTSDGGNDPTRPPRTVVSTETMTRPPQTGSFTPPAPSTVKGLPPGKKAPRGERDGKCPYIRTGLNIGKAGENTVADIEGNRIARNTIITGDNPVGCRFYFIGPPYNATADIRPQTFATATQAFNAMVLTARTGTDSYTRKNFVPGVTGIGYRTKFGGEHGARDWAFAFAKGKVLVVVHTERQDMSVNALYLAQAIVGKF